MSAAPAMPGDDLYALLGVDARVNGEQLRRVWRKIARRWHPDHAGAAATATFQKLAAAYEVLSDPIARAAYDRRRSAAMPATSSHTAKPTAPRSAASAAAPAAPRRRAPSTMLSRLCGPLSSLLACGFARRAEAGVIELFLSAREAAQGGMIAISMRVPVRKPHGIVEELFSAWLAIAPEIADGSMVAPSVLLPDMIQPVSFRIRVQPAKA